jgi:TetR/AcrR family transcriptional regulator
MSEPGSRRGRVHDAEGTRQAILNAAEQVFAEHGFDGARIDTIAETAGYNKSLIFHYYGDKLGLYTAVIKRIDKQGNELQYRILAPLLTDERLTSDACTFRTFLRTVIRMIFDFMVEHPYVVRIIAWEAAEGWQTTRKIVPQLNTDDEILYGQLMRKAQESGLIRPGMDTNVMLGTTYTACLSYLTFAPRWEMTLKGEDLLSPDALARAREMIADFVIHGIMVDPGEA